MIELLSSEGKFEEFFWARPATMEVMVGAFVAVLLLTAFLYCRRQGLPGRVRLALALFRLVALAVLVAAIFEPMATVTHSHTESRRLPVLIDISESMSVKDQRKRSEDVGEAAAALGILAAFDRSR